MIKMFADLSWQDFPIYRKSGIYCITFIHPITGKYIYYIGKAKKLRKRWTYHIGELVKNKHKNKFIQNTFNTYGKDHFYFNIEMYVPDLKNLPYFEQKVLNMYLTKKEKVFNLLLDVINCTKYNNSSETKEYFLKAKEVKKLLKSKICPTLINVYTKHEINQGLNYMDTAKLINTNGSAIGDLIADRKQHVKGYVIKEKYEGKALPTEFKRKPNSFPMSEETKRKHGEASKKVFQNPEIKKKFVDGGNRCNELRKKKTPELIHIQTKHIIESYESKRCLCRSLGWSRSTLAEYLNGNKLYVKGYIKKEEYDCLSEQELNSILSHYNIYSKPHEINN